jgi:hypothetical protein
MNILPCGEVYFSRTTTTGPFRRGWEGAGAPEVRFLFSTYVRWVEKSALYTWEWREAEEEENSDE